MNKNEDKSVVRMISFFSNLCRYFFHWNYTCILFCCYKLTLLCRQGMEKVDINGKTYPLSVLKSYEETILTKGHRAHQMD